MSEEGLPLPSTSEGKTQSKWWKPQFNRQASPNLRPKVLMAEAKTHTREFLTEWYEMCFTREGFIGDIDYSYLLTPTIPFTRWKSNPPRFFGLESKMPLLLVIILGLQHAMAMMGGLISPSLIFTSTANLSTRYTEYLISAALMGSGFLTFMQVRRLRVPWTNYYIGTGMISVLGETFTSIPVFQSAIPIMYQTGFCPTASDGTKLPCPDAYGALLATGALCALVQLLMAFIPPKVLQRLFPSVVTGPVVLLIGASLAQTGMQDWAGGSDCYPSGSCNSLNPSHAHPWGSGQWVGLGFSVVVTILICDKFGAPLLKSCSIVVGLLVGCIIAAATGYFEHYTIDEAPSGEFMWVKTFKLQLYGPIVLPIIAVYIVAVMESIGDITATADVSRTDVEGEVFESRVQGGILASGIASIIGCLGTLSPMGTFAQNNGVVAMTQVASRRVGYSCCVWLVLMGVIGKFSAAIAAIPKACIGGMTTFLFTSVAVSGLAIISKNHFTRRDRVVLTITLVFGFGSLLVPTWFQGVFTYKGNNRGKQGFIDAIIIVVQTPYAIAGLVGVLANLILKPQSDDDGIDEGSDPSGQVIMAASSPDSPDQDPEDVKGLQKQREAEIV